MLASFPDNGARAGALAIVPAIEHGSARQNNRGNVDGGGGHDTGGGGLIAAGCQHNAVQRIAVQDFHKAQIGQIAVKGRGGALAGFLNGMNRKFKGHAACGCNAVTHALGQFKMVSVAR